MSLDQIVNNPFVWAAGAGALGYYFWDQIKTSLPASVSSQSNTVEAAVFAVTGYLVCVKFVSGGGFGNTLYSPESFYS